VSDLHGPWRLGVALEQRPEACEARAGREDVDDLAFACQ